MCTQLTRSFPKRNFSPLVFLLAYHQPESIPFAIAATGFVLVCAFVPQVTVTSEGIRINRVFRLLWEDVRGATVRKYFGQTSLLVKRKRGFPVTVRFLLQVKWIFLLGHEDLYELTGNVRGFQFGSLERQKRVEVVVFGPDSEVYLLSFSNCSANEPLTQSDILAVASTLQPAPAVEILH